MSIFSRDPHLNQRLHRWEPYWKQPTEADKDLRRIPSPWVPLCPLRPDHWATGFRLKFPMVNLWKADMAVEDGAVWLIDRPRKNGDLP